MKREQPTVKVPPNQQMPTNLQKLIPLIINHLHPKTHETTGNKPAKPISSHSFLGTATEITNKPNMPSAFLFVAPAPPYQSARHWQRGYKQASQTCQHLAR